MSPHRFEAQDFTNSDEYRRSALEAGEWMVRLAGVISDDDRRRFFAWLCASSLNLYAFKQVSSLEDVLDGSLGKRLPSTSNDLSKAGGIILPPGYRLSALARFFLTRDAYRRYVGQVIADMQTEYIQAIAVRDEWRARWIQTRGWLLVIPGWLYALVAGKLAAFLRSGR